MDTSPTPADRRSHAQQLVTPPGGDIADLSRAPLPTEATLRRRQSIPLQLARFAVLNARIMRMVLKGHSAP